MRAHQLIACRVSQRTFFFSTPATVATAARKTWRIATAKSVTFACKAHTCLSAQPSKLAERQTCLREPQHCNAAVCRSSRQICEAEACSRASPRNVHRLDRAGLLRVVQHAAGVCVAKAIVRVLRVQIQRLQVVLHSRSQVARRVVGLGGVRLAEQKPGKLASGP